MLSEEQTLKIHEIILLPVSKVRLDIDNPNVMSKAQMNGLRESFKRFGYLDPIVVDQDLVIADGEHRLIIYQEFGRKEIPAYVLTLTPTDRRLLRQTKNKLHGEHEWKKDAVELRALFDAGQLPFLSVLIARETKDLMKLLRTQEKLPLIHEDDAPDPNAVEKRVEPGEIWQLGRHRLMCGDATSTKDLDALIGKDKIQVLWTDPPYGVAYDKGNDMAADSGFKSWGAIEGDKDPDLFVKFIHVMAERISDASWYICCSSRHLPKIINSIEEHQIHIATPIIWVKQNSVMSWERYHAKHEVIIFSGDGSQPTGPKSIWYGPNNETTIWQIPIDNSASYVHPTQKPLALVTRALVNSSKKNDVVLDPFVGSGTSIIACEQINRRCLAMEITPHFCDVIIARWEKLGGQKAVKQ